MIESFTFVAREKATGLFMYANDKGDLFLLVQLDPQRDALATAEPTRDVHATVDVVDQPQARGVRDRSVPAHRGEGDGARTGSPIVPGMKPHMTYRIREKFGDHQVH
jgi:hypothetical protein